MGKSAKEWKALLNLDEEPSAEMLARLNQAHAYEQKHRDDSEVASKAADPNIPSLSPQEILQMVQGLHIERTLADLLKSARQEAGQSLAEVADGMGVVRSRIQAVEKSENLEVQTLVRYLEALDYQVLITLIPKQPGKRVMSVQLGK